MQTILKYYNLVCAKKYKSFGFIRQKTTFARIRGDVIQAFSLKLSQDFAVCSVEFGIFPLCLPTPIFLNAGGYELDAFIIEPHEGASGWVYDRGSEESMMNCVESISDAIDFYLLPFFEICSDCKSALTELIKLEELFDCNRQIKIQLNGDSDSADPWQERSLFDTRKYFMALKSHNLSYANQYLRHQIAFYKSSLKLFDNIDSPKQPDIVRERFLNNLAVCTEQLKRLNSEEFGYFDDLLNANENQMKKFLTTKHPKLFTK